MGTTSRPNRTSDLDELGVALSSVVGRLHRLGRFTDWQYRALFVELPKKGYRTVEPEDVPREAPAVLEHVHDVAQRREIPLRTSDKTRLVT